MPCNGDHMNPNQREKDSREICRHLVYLHKYNDQRIPQWAKEGAKNLYGAQNTDFDVQVSKLCKILKKTHEDFIYNGRCPKARKLADWWDRHKKADKEREKKENLQRIKIDIYRKMKAKFTDEELEALNIAAPKGWNE